MAHGGNAADAFDVVIPSLPGFGFSGPTQEAGWNAERTARAWAELMARLGYDRFGAHGNDAGSMISPRLGAIAPERVTGVHVMQVFSFPSGDPAEFAEMSEQDMAQMQQLQWFMENKFSFNQLHSQQPQTLAHALADSPAGLLGWHLQLMDDGAMGGRRLDEDFILTNVALYWLTNTAGSAIRMYFEDAKTAGESGPTEVPLGVAGFAGDFTGVRKFAERDHRNIVSWNLYDAPGGHYAAHLETGLLAEDIRRFYRAVAERSGGRVASECHPFRAASARFRYCAAHRIGTCVALCRKALMTAGVWLTPGQLSERSGVAVSTLHYYESRG